MTKRVAGGLIASVAIVLLFFFGRGLITELRTVGVGAPAPDFTALTLDAAPRAKTLADYQGQVVLLNIWATWCAPCRIEMPAIESLHDAYKDRGLKVVAVSIDDAGYEPRIRSFADSLRLTFEILHDSTGLIQRAYQTTGVTETVIIGRDGLIRKRVVGAVQWDSPANRKLVEQLLAKPAS